MPGVETDAQKFERIKKAVGSAMNNPQAQKSQILRDFEWIIAYTSRFVPAPTEPKPAPSNNRHIMELRQEHLKALDYVAKNAGRAHDIIPDNHALHVRLAEEAVQIMKEVFGASSQSYITLYPTIG